MFYTLTPEKLLAPPFSGQRGRLRRDRSPSDSARSPLGAQCDGGTGSQEPPKRPWSLPAGVLWISAHGHQPENGRHPNKLFREVRVLREEHLQPREQALSNRRSGRTGTGPRRHLLLPHGDTDQGRSGRASLHPRFAGTATTQGARKLSLSHVTERAVRVRAGCHADNGAAGSAADTATGNRHPAHNTQAPALCGSSEPCPTARRRAQAHPYAAVEAAPRHT